MGFAYDTLEKIGENNITLNNNKNSQVEKMISAFMKCSKNISEYKGLIKKSIISLITSFSILDDIDEIKSNKWYIKSYTETINNEYDLRSMLEYSVLMTDMIKRNEELRDKFASEVNRLKCSEVDIASYSDKYGEMVKTLKYYGEGNE